MIAVGLASLLGFAASASAAPDSHNIDPTQKGSITLTKYSTPESERTTTEGDGKQQAAPPSTNSTLLDGATFQIFKVGQPGLDLTTNSGWTTLETLISGTGPHPAQSDLAAVPGVTLTSLGAATTRTRCP